MQAPANNTQSAAAATKPTKPAAAAAAHGGRRGQSGTGSVPPTAVLQGQQNKYAKMM